ncbi:hypothetical protein M422DRAFT_271166 [Sphaerobolus stellatus SS14]|uniref:Uncharacterized protein n=1 Tax=Sphaerobolus stellatus (strain SS14) TaxID=990650 RepID=A0A0C9UQK9_SPHS4|nr:hypothetical protein M422DRAFT_271166 [Sphaerobolus stellatus SS14]
MALTLGSPAALSVNTENAIFKPLDVISSFVTLQESVEIFDLGNGQQGFILHPTAANAGLRAAAAPLTWKIAIGPLEINVTIDLSNFSVALTVLLNLPFIGTVTVANIVGNLKQGVNVSIGFPGFLGGTVGLHLTANNDIVLDWDFTALGSSYKGSKVLFHI